HTVHAAWATFLGAIRLSVYAVLIFIFLLPGCQHFKAEERQSRVILVFDVSRSMQWKDEIAKTPEEEKALLSRQDKVVNFLTSPYTGQENTKKFTFIQHLHEKNPVYCYRFGLTADLTPADPNAVAGWTRGQWETWLKPDPNDVKMPEPTGDSKKDEEARNAATK